MDVKVENYLPMHIVVTGLGLIVAGLLCILTSTFVGIGLLLGGLILSTTQHRLAINFDKKYYREYVWMLGLKWGQKIKFNEVEYLYITKSKTSQEYGPYYRRIYTSGQCFNGYLKFSENEKIFIGDNTSKDKLLKKMNRINSKMNLRINDYAMRQ